MRRIFFWWWVIGWWRIIFWGLVIGWRLVVVITICWLIHNHLRLKIGRVFWY
jgi:hypothetical protein